MKTREGDADGATERAKHGIAAPASARAGEAIGDRAAPAAQQIGERPKAAAE